MLANSKVIDLSADFRIKDVAVYKKWYKLEYNTKDLIEEAVYGLPELYREDIKSARCVDAIENGVNRVTIADGRVEHCLLLEMFTNKGIGTMIVGDE